jgi:hypothetical protein
MPARVGGVKLLLVKFNAATRTNSIDMEKKNLKNSLRAEKKRLKTKTEKEKGKRRHVYAQCAICSSCMRNVRDIAVAACRCWHT